MKHTFKIEKKRNKIEFKIRHENSNRMMHDFQIFELAKALAPPWKSSLEKLGSAL